MRVLVTGGAGFIGSHIADALLARGHEVSILDDLSTGHRHNVPEGAELSVVDLRDGASVAALVAAVRPEVVFHEAAQTSVSASVRDPIADAEANVVGSLHLLQACVAHGVKRVVFASTGGAIYGEVPEGERAETSWPAKPLSPYACAKLSIERYLDFYRAEHGLASTVLRYANVFGPRQDPHGEAGVVAIFAQRLLANEPIRINAMREPGDDGCIRDYVYVDDVVRANLAALDGAVEGTVNVATGLPTTTRAIAEALRQTLRDGAEIGHGPRRPGDLERSVLEPDPALGETVSLEEGLERTAQWFSDRSTD